MIINGGDGNDQQFSYSLLGRSMQETKVQGKAQFWACVLTTKERMHSLDCNPHIGKKKQPIGQTPIWMALEVWPVWFPLFASQAFGVPARRLCQAVPHKHICTRRCCWLPKRIFSAVEWGAFNNSAFIGIFLSRFSLTFLNASDKFEGQSGFWRSEQAVFQSLHKSDSFKQQDTFLRCWGLWNGFCSCKIGNACNNAEISYHNKQGN